jgi:septum formation protein
MRIILASASPQRRQLLEGLHVKFEVMPSTFAESDHPERDPASRAKVLARMKAQEVHGRVPDACIIGCDTLVVAPDGTLLEKPADAKDAERMLRLQSGGVSTVHSALCVIGSKGIHEGISSSRVQFKALSDADISWWLSTGQWKDRSGAFQIDGPGQLMIERIEGDWTGVVGLPVFLLGQLLEEEGVKWKIEN